MISSIIVCVLIALGALALWAEHRRRHQADLRQRVLLHLGAGESHSLTLSSMLDVSLPTVYRVMRALEAEGLVISRDGEPLPERGGRPRRYYRLSPRGYYICALDRWGQS